MMIILFLFLSNYFLLTYTQTYYFYLYIIFPCLSNLGFVFVDFEDSHSVQDAVNKHFIDYHGSRVSKG